MATKQEIKKGLQQEHWFDVKKKNVLLFIFILKIHQWCSLIKFKVIIIVYAECTSLVFVNNKR